MQASSPPRPLGPEASEPSSSSPSEPPPSSVSSSLSFLVAPEASQEASARDRLVLGMALTLTEKGYAELTVADVVRHARVSKRTFYQHFGDKEACYLAAYAVLSDQMLTRVAEAATLPEDAEASFERSTEAYLMSLQEVPALARTFLTEVQGLGAAAVKQRRAVLQRFADLLCLLVERLRQGRPALRALSPQMATALVGGVNELIMFEIEAGRVGQLMEVHGTVVQLMRAVILRQDDARTPSEAGTPVRRR